MRKAFRLSLLSAAVLVCLWTPSFADTAVPTSCDGCNRIIRR